MQAWIYDENGWPSGFVGGKLLKKEEYRARFLEYTVGDYDASAFACFTEDKEKGFVRVREKKKGENRYHNVYLRISLANTDILNPRVTEAFIEETHEKYYERFKERFGRELTGFFTDEPQYYRWGTPFTSYAEVEFERMGEDIRDGLIWLFVHDERGYGFREKYFRILNKLYVENFYGKLYDWCKAHHCKLTGHSTEESALYTQMWGAAAVMPTYEYEDIPAIDWLGRCYGRELSAKQVGSVASQLGKKRVLTETYGCAGYDVTPKELKSIGNFQYFNGVNMMCQHLYPYSIAGQGKIDNPPIFSPQGNWFKEFKVFNDHFTRLGYIVANTREKYDIAILHPQREVWLEYVQKEDYESVKGIEDEFNKLLDALRRKGVTYQLIDERILERYGKIENGALQVGENNYETLVIPKMRTISRETYNLLRGYEGRLCILGKLEYIDGKKASITLHGNISLDEIIVSAKIKYNCDGGNSFITSRVGTIGDFMFLENLSSTEESRITLTDIAEKYVALNLETLETQKISNRILLPAKESLILVRDETAEETDYIATEKDVTDAFEVTGISENYFVMDYAEISKDGTTYGPKRPITWIFESLLREDYKGLITVRQRFVLKERMPLNLVMEKADFLSIKINGQDIYLKKSEFDINFVEGEIGENVKEGENELTYTFEFFQHNGVGFALFDSMATESLRNCLYYDTSIETTYLKGDFVVNKDMVIEKRKKFPQITSALYKYGYPFFKGEIVLHGKLEKPKTGRAILSLRGRFMAAEIKINGQKTKFVLDDKGDITNYLKEGKNSVQITLKSSLRNLFGPHHYHSEDNLYVSPFHFTFRGKWGKQEAAKDYMDQYNSVPFGVENIILTTEKIVRKDKNIESEHNS